jgi:hypothetical protein
MTTITVMRGEDGKLAGFTERDKRAYARFRKEIEELQPGELFEIKHWFPRNPKLHKLHFAVVKALFDAQEQFSDMDDLRKWLYVGAGYADFLPGPKGRMVAIPKSIAFNRIDDAEFSELHGKVQDFVRSAHCQRFLWSHLDENQAAEMAEGVLSQFEVPA